VNMLNSSSAASRHNTAPTRTKGNRSHRSSMLHTTRSLADRQRAQTASSVLNSERTSLPSLLANAHGKPVLLGGGGGGGGGTNGMNGMNGMHGCNSNGNGGAATTQHHKRPHTVGDYRRRTNTRTTRCPGKYCTAVAHPAPQTLPHVTNKASTHPTDRTDQPPPNNPTDHAPKGGEKMCSLLYKSIVADRYEGRMNQNTTVRDRAKMYTTVQVCQNCYVHYTSKDKVREHRKEQSSLRATKMLNIAAQKYSKYTGNNGVKIKAGSSRVEQLYEKSKNNGKLPPEIRAALMRTGNVGLSKAEQIKLVQEYAHREKEAGEAAVGEGGGEGEREGEGEAPLTATMFEQFEQEYAATAAMEDITFEQVQLQKEKVDVEGEEDADDENVCLLCEEDVSVCQCNLSPRVDVRALIGRVVPDLF
jgi:hypothetical protein